MNDKEKIREALIKSFRILHDAHSALWYHQAVDKAEKHALDALDQVFKG